MSVPKIEPISIKEYTVKQSKYDVAPTLSIRSVILGPSGSGKTILIQNTILDIYKDCFSKISIFSPSINVDATWGKLENTLRSMWKLHTQTKSPFVWITTTLTR